MDPASQGLLGAAVVQSTFGYKSRVNLWLLAIIAAVAPDLDVLIRSQQDPLLSLYYHRHFTHALAFIPIGGVLVSAAFIALFKSYRREWSQVMMASIVAYGTHGLLDWCTSYGTVLLWPFNNVRYSLDIISIVDPIFTGVLFIGVAFSAVYESVKPARIGLALCAVYLAFAGWQHHRALQQQQYFMAQQGKVLQHGRVKPALGHLFRWQSFAIADDRIQLGSVKTPLFSEAHYSDQGSLSWYQEKDLPKAVMDSPSLRKDFQVFNWFSDGYLAKFSETPLILVDARYLLKTTPPRTALWGIEFPTNATREHIYLRRQIVEKK